MSERLIVDYTKMKGPELMEALGIDASKWADAFVQHRNANKEYWTDVSLMTGWFSNAMMAMHDHIRGNPPLNGDHAQYLLDKEQG